MYDGHSIPPWMIIRGNLILVLMEDALRDDKNMYVLVDLCDVLILVLMEDALRVSALFTKALTSKVLILVLMEDALRVDFSREVKISEVS